MNDFFPFLNWALEKNESNALSQRVCKQNSAILSHFENNLPISDFFLKRTYMDKTVIFWMQQIHPPPFWRDSEEFRNRVLWRSMMCLIIRSALNSIEVFFEVTVVLMLKL